jgi:tRNA1Val (adenine37-N6)-methyltransferase
MKVTTDSCLFGAWAAEQVRNVESEVNNILDIGTGTGLLSLMLAQNCNAAIDAIEIDKQTATQATENVQVSPFSEKIKTHFADVHQFGFEKKYDIIISNPPFYENELKSEYKKKNIAHHNEGLLLKDLLPVIHKQLQPNGSFYLLLPFKRNEEIRNLLVQHEFAIRKMTFVRQSAKHDYFRIMVAGRIKTDNIIETIIDEISIRDEEENYTSAFTNLLRDYYLYL